MGQISSQPTLLPYRVESKRLCWVYVEQVGEETEAWVLLTPQALEEAARMQQDMPPRLFYQVLRSKLRPLLEAAGLGLQSFQDG